MSAVKVILRADVSGVGKRGDIVEVSKGYARNFLEPRQLALPATPGAEGQAQAMRKARDVRDTQNRESAEEIAKSLVARSIEIQAKAGGGGRLFGSVTTAEVADAVLAQTGLVIDRKDLVLDEHIKDVGEHQVIAHLHADVQFPITINVVAS